MSQAKDESNTSRRKFLSAAATAAAMAPIISQAKADRIDHVALMGKALDDAQAALDAYEFLNRGKENDESDAEYMRLFDQCGDIVNHILWMKADTIDGFRLKARAFRWCDPDLMHGATETTDMRLAQSIIKDLLSLQTV